MGDEIRKDDLIVERLDQKFTDFLERYERDWKDTQAWRKAHWELLNTHTQLLNEIVPNYRRGLWALTIIVAGSIALAVQSFWKHIKVLWA